MSSFQELSFLVFLTGSSLVLYDGNQKHLESEQLKDSTDLPPQLFFRSAWGGLDDASFETPRTL